MLLHDLLDDLELRDHLLEVRGETGVDLGSIVHDSRDVTPGALFCCIPGERADGHDYAPAAVAAGAVALLVSARSRSTCRRCASIPCAACSVRCATASTSIRPALRVLGVTGTNGKTSTTYLLEAIARANGDRPGVIGTVEARIAATVVPLQHTTPEATELQALLARMRNEAVETVAMEVSSHALDQHRVDGTHFAAVTFTNLSHDHLDYHPSVDAYFEAKARLFDPRFSARAAINVDDPYGVVLADRARDLGMQVYTYSVENDSADVYARDLLLRRDGTTFDLVDTRTEHHGVVRSSLAGRFNVANALAAAADRARRRLVVRGRPGRARGARPRARAVRTRRHGPRLRGARRLRPHPRRAGVGARCGAGAGRRREARRRVRLRRRPRPFEAAGHG